MPTTVPTDEPVAISAFTDSRQIVPGSVFVAIAGERVDGHDFVPKVGAQGAVAALVDHEIAGAQVPQIVVENTVKALGALAKHNIERRRALESPFTVIGITGSVGKTTTKDLLKSLLSKMGDTVAPVGSFNNEIGLPLTSLKVNAGTRFLVAEMGGQSRGRNRPTSPPWSAGHRVVAQGGRGGIWRIRLCGTHRPSQIGNRTRTGAGRPDHPQRQRRTCGRDERHRSGRCAVVRPAAERRRATGHDRARRALRRSRPSVIRTGRQDRPARQRHARHLRTAQRHERACRSHGGDDVGHAD